MEARGGPRSNSERAGDGLGGGGGGSGSSGSSNGSVERASDISADVCAAPDTEQAAKARSGGRRRSCNRCSSKKERCDGQEPCQRCVRSRLECFYSTCRTLGRPRNTAPTSKKRSSSASRKKANPSEGVTPPTWRATGANAAPFAGAGTAMGGDETVVGAVTKNAAGLAVETSNDAAGSWSTGGAVTVGSIVAVATPATKSPSLKRLFLSASPATGLKGMVENVYLSWFVEDFASFFRVLDDSTIRLGLINLMTDKVDVLRLASTDRSRPPPSKKRSAKATAPKSSTGSFQETNPSGRGKAKSTTSTEDIYAINSSIFSAMALGALLAGRMPSHVQQYVEVAEASLRICGLEMGMSPVPNERVAAAHLLLAFASSVAGQKQYHFHIVLTRQCYEECMRLGFYTPPPICEILRYRAIIDALGKPLDSGIVPSPREDDVPDAVGDGEVVVASNDKSSSGRKHCRGGRSRGRNGRADADTQPSGSALKRTDLSAAGAATAMSSPHLKTRAIEVLRAREEVGGRIVHGVEAARERSQRREAEPLLMICDIMTMLSKVPWSTEEGAHQTRNELRELRSLVVAEKELLEERRSARRERSANISNTLGYYTLNSAMVGLHCALNEFAELLPLGRGLATCISACPGLARYNVHAYHTALAILRAFDKREEFDNVVKEVPRELRFITPSGRFISFDAEEEEMCAMPVCVRHVRLIQDLGRKHRRKSSPAPAEPSVALAEVEGSTVEVVRSVNRLEPLPMHPTAGVARREQPELHDDGTTLNLTPQAEPDEDQYKILPDPSLSVERDRLDSSQWNNTYESEWCENLAVEGAEEMSMTAEVKDGWPWVRPCSSSSHWASPPLPEDRLGSALPDAIAVGDNAAADLSHPTAARSAGTGEEGESGRRLPSESTALSTFAQLGSAGGSGVCGEGTLKRSAAIEARRVPPLLAASREDHLPSSPTPHQQRPRGEGTEVDTGKGRSPAGEEFGFVGDTRQPWRRRRGEEQGRLGWDGNCGDGENDIDKCRNITGRRDGNFALKSIPRQTILRAGWTTSELGGLSNEGLSTEMNICSGGTRPSIQASAPQAVAKSQQAPQDRTTPGGLLTKRLWGSGMPFLHAKDKGGVSPTNAARGGARSSWPWSQTQPGTDNATKISSPTESSIASCFPVPSGSTRDVVQEVASVAAAELPSLITTMRNARGESRTAPPVFSAGAATLSSSSHYVVKEGEELCYGGAGAGDSRAVCERRGVRGSESAVEVSVGRSEDEDDILNLWNMIADEDAPG